MTIPLATLPAKPREPQYHYVPVAQWRCSWWYRLRNCEPKEWFCDPITVQAESYEVALGKAFDEIFKWSSDAVGVEKTRQKLKDQIIVRYISHVTRKVQVKS